MLFRKVILVISLLLLASHLIAQDYSVKGKVLDTVTREPLAFVNILINNGKYGGTTDIDGNFKLKFASKITSLKFSYVGYKTRVIAIERNHQEITVLLKRIKVQLDEVVIVPGINPAHRIINNVIENRDNNNPEKLKSFSYTSYDKMIFTVNADSLLQVDTALLEGSAKELVEFFGEKDLFIMETVSERRFLYPDRDFEKVIATRVAGFKDPIFVFLISQMQSTSFYEDLIRIAGRSYVNPISNGSLNKYIFILEDTAYTERNDTVFIVSFSPKRNTNFDGLSGILSINTHGWAIQNVRAEPAKLSKGFNIKIQQLYKLIDEEHWFPVQLNTDIIIGNAEIRAGEESYNMIGIGKSYIQDIVLNPDLVKRKLGVLGVDVEPGAYSRSDEFWSGYRNDSLTERNEKTYSFMDSIGKEYHFDRYAKTYETLISGKIPWGFVDFDINKFFRYNDYEGFFLGLGLHTNDRLSRTVKFGGYWGYGFRDKRAKYGADIGLNIIRNQELTLNLMYRNDVTESGGVKFFDDKPGAFKEKNFRQFLIQRQNNTLSYGISLGVRAFKYFKFNVGMSINRKMAFKDYAYGVVENGVAHLMNEFNFTDLMVGFRYAFREKFIRTTNTRVSMGTKYPVLWVQYTHGFNNILKGEFEYNRIDVKIEETFYTKYLGETKLQLRLGYIDGNLPYCNLYNGNGSWRKFTIFAPNSFATMRMNEFLSNRYLALYFDHSFEKLLIQKKYFSPVFIISTNLAFGALNNKDQHFNESFKTMELGYYESGLRINRLLNLPYINFGVAAYYRYGPYSFEKTIDNFGFKFTLVYGFN